MRDYQLPAADAQTFVWDVALGDYFESFAAASQKPQSRRQLGHQQSARQTGRDRRPPSRKSKFAPAAILELVELVESGQLSNRIAQQVFAQTFATGESPAPSSKARAWPK